MEIAVLVSGGVDSSVVTHLLKEQGYDIHLFYIKIGMKADGFTDCSVDDDLELCQMISTKYEAPLDVVDLHDDYWNNVVQYTIDKVRRGLTPNPDVMCNKLIKFGCFEEKVGYQFDKTATGHYATTTIVDGLTYLSTAVDPVKDQTDFLAQINSVQVSKLMFPIGGMMKSEVREIARNAKIPTAYRKDSQGICFLGKINYNDFIRRYLGEKEGKIVELETGKVLGKHKGFWFHTIGQRKGLGLSGGPWYVVKKDLNENIVYVSCGYDTQMQYGDDFKIKDMHYITKDMLGECKEADITIKIRHTPEFTKARITKVGDVYRIQSEEKLQGIAPGQFCVVYDEHSHICIGSGEITL